MSDRKSSSISSRLLCALPIALLSLIYFAAAAAQASLVIIDAPPSVQPGAIQSQTDATMFLESVSSLASDLPVDIATPGLYTNASPSSPGAIPATIKVASYMIHHESVDHMFSSVLVSFTFPKPVLGVITSDALLDSSDSILGNPSTSYPTGLANRGLELPFPIFPDAIFWNGNQVFFQVDTNTAAVLDQLRVITAVPEPSMFLIFLLLGISAWGIRRIVPALSFVGSIRQN
jgi:hypothetical protein